MSPPQQLNEFLYILCVTGKKSNKNIISLGNIDTSMWRVLAVGVLYSVFIHLQNTFMFSLCCLMLSLDCGSEFKDIFVNTVGIVTFPLLVSG